MAGEADEDCDVQDARDYWWRVVHECEMGLKHGHELGGWLIGGPEEWKIVWEAGEEDTEEEGGCWWDVRWCFFGCKGRGASSKNAGV